MSKSLNDRAAGPRSKNKKGKIPLTQQQLTTSTSAMQLTQSSVDVNAKEVLGSMTKFDFVYVGCVDVLCCAVSLILFDGFVKSYISACLAVLLLDTDCC